MTHLAMMIIIKKPIHQLETGKWQEKYYYILELCEITSKNPIYIND